MTNLKTGASYLDRQVFVFNEKNLPKVSFWALILLTPVCIGLVYAILAAAYILMSYGAVFPDDAAGAQNIQLVHSDQNYYIRDNKESGQILIATGMIRNAYSEPREFIRLRGQLLGRDGAILADKFVYAGNIVSEGELVSLAMADIMNLLSTKSGQAGLNLNIAPGAEIPFMIVFDKLPDDLLEYRIDSVASSPAR